MSKSDTQRTAEETTCEGARQKITEEIVFRARQIAAHYEQEIKDGRIRLPHYGIRLRLQVDLLDLNFPERIKGSEPMLGSSQITFSNDDLKKPDEGIVMMLETNERKWNTGLLCPKCASDNLAQNPDQLYRYCENCEHYPIAPPLDRQTHG